MLFSPPIKRHLLRLCTIFAMVNSTTSAAETPAYRNPTLPIAARVEDLLGRMTLREKAGQMSQYVGFRHLKSVEAVADTIPETDDSTGVYPGLTYAELWRRVRAGEVGSFLLIVEGDEANKVQEAARESRLGIPLLLGMDAIHGHGFGRGSTIYPTPLNFASTFDPGLMQRAAREVAAELRSHGIHWVFTPNIDVARDPRWGRVGETFGEDPYLVGQMGAAAVRGYSDGGPNGERGVLSCLKHLIAGSEPANGLNAAAMDVSERTLRAVHWPPYEAAIEAGAQSVMLAHHDLNGVPCHAHPGIVNDDLRGRLGFSGFVVSDWTDVRRLMTVHRVAETFEEAVRLSLEAGLDMHMHGPGFLEAVIALVESGRISEARIDESVRRLLRVKFELGLFEQPLVAADAAAQVVWQPAHQATALEVARKSIVLLRNEGGLLPLQPAAGRKILLTGPFADSHAILGDWSYAQPAERVTTILAGLRALAGGAQIEFADVGEEPRTMTPEAIAAAATAAQAADVVVAVVGESAFRPHKLRTSGENHDRADLDLTGKPEALLEALRATGKPLVVVLVQSRPISSPGIAAHARALVVAGEPGAFGGQAVAEVLLGAVNPSGRLPMSVARSVGHIPSYYNHTHAHYWRSYAVGEARPFFSFGDGLSYTQFTYSKLTVPAVVRPGEDVTVAVEVANTGARAGDEVVLAFVSDMVASVTVPVRELKAFTRVSLAPGERRAVSVTIPYAALALVNTKLERVVEPGEFEIAVGTEKARFKVAP